MGSPSSSTKESPSWSSQLFVPDDPGPIWEEESSGPHRLEILHHDSLEKPHQYKARVELMGDLHALGTHQKSTSTFQMRWTMSSKARRASQRSQSRMRDSPHPILSITVNDS